MQNITIGKSGIEVPFLGMGTWAIGGGSWWGDNDDALSVNAIEAAVEQGIRWIDTAPIYGLYHSEQVVGEALRHIDRDKVVLSTKCGLEWRHETPVLHKVVDGTAVYRDLSAQSIIEDVEESLKRLGTDHLDVLYTHWQSPDLGLYPLEETVEAMMKLKEQGKIRAIGASNVTADIIRGYCKYGQLDVIQEKYSLLTRRVEKQLAGYYAALEAGEKLGLTVYCGWELTYQDNAEDYLTLGLSPQFLYDHPWLERYDIEKYRDAVHAAGGILVRAHPYRRAWYIKKPYVEREGIADAIEVFNGGNSSQEENDMALAYAQKHNMPMTGGSDAHHVDETARGYIALEKKAESYAELCEAIRTGKAIVMHK